MGWRDNDDEDDDDDDFDPPPRRRSIRRRASAAPAGSAALGIASVSISIFAGLLIFGLIAAAAVMSVGQNGPMNDRDPRIVTLGLGVICDLLFAVVGVVLGAVGYMRANMTGIICSTLGLIFNGLIVIGILGLMCIGMLQ